MTEALESLQAALTDRYTLERELGRGGMAAVYLAEDRKHGRKVAIKVLHPELSALLGGERFLAEIKLTASLQHPHILGLLDSGSADGHLYYVMPFVAGESLRLRLAREKQLPLAEAIRLVAEVADALDYAHQRGIIHRDIKPENILLQGEHALVADFGIALALEEAGGSRRTQTGLSLGTPQYMSPEQASGERELTRRSDIYSLGAVMYELLTGQPPFVAATAQGVIARVMTEEPTPPSRQRRSVPPQVDAAVLTALEKLPADRFANGAAFVRALTTTTALPAAPGGVRRPGLQAPLLTIAGAGLALAVGFWLGRLGEGEAAASVSGGLRRLSLLLPDSAPLSVGTGRPAVALTPDGSRLLYVARVHGENVVMVRDLRSDSAWMIPGSTGGTGPVVTPSGRAVAYFVDWEMMTSPVNGGQPRRLEGITPVTRGAAWLTDSTAAVATDPNGAVIQVPLRQPPDPATFVWLSGRNKPPEVGHAWPELLPGGTAVLYAITDETDPGNWRIAARRLPDGAERILVEGGSNPRYVSSGHLVFVREGSLWAVELDAERLAVRGSPALVQSGVLTEPDGLAHYVISSNGTLVYAAGGGWQPARRLAWVLGDGDVEALPIADGMYEAAVLAPDGRRAALVRADGSNHDVWIGDLGRGTLVPITRHLGEDGAPVWSSDGRRLALATEQWGGPPKLAIADLVGGLKLIVDRGPRFSAPTGWSKDGSRILFNTNAVGLGPTSTGSDILVLDGSKERSWLRTTNYEGSAVESPDGQWVAYVSNESGRQEVYLRSLSGQEATVPVSVSGGVEPRWGQSSGSLYYRRGDLIFVVAVKPGDAHVPELSAPRPFIRLPPSFVTNTGFSGPPWDLAPDERRVLGVEDRKHLAVRSLRVVLDWPAVLRAATRGGRNE